MGGNSSAAGRPTGPVSSSRYQILRRLARGGMAEILLGCQTGAADFSRFVAIKRIQGAHAEHPQFIRMFLEEARLAAQLHHHNIVEVYDVGHDGQGYFQAMQYLHGRDARGVLQQVNGPLPVELALYIASSVAEGLRYAHDRVDRDGRPLQIVHRDLSPANIMITFDGAVKILDFGIARAAFRAADTQTGSLKGKVPYMSPEQASGAAIDRRSDLFSLGIVLFELTTGYRPFARKGDREVDILRRIQRGDYPLPGQVVAGYPRPLEAVIQRALHRDLGQRHQTAQELLEDIEAAQQRLGAFASSTAMARYMRRQFGAPPEPWRDTPGADALVAKRGGTVTDAGVWDRAAEPLGRHAAAQARGGRTPAWAIASALIALALVISGGVAALALL